MKWVAHCLRNACYECFDNAHHQHNCINSTRRIPKFTRNDELFGRLRRILDVLAQGLLETTGTLAINRDDESIRKLLLEIITDLSERDSPI